MTAVMALTQKGKRALNSGIVLSPLHQLMLVICDEIGDEVVTANMVFMVQELIKRFGSPDAAIDAINSGFVEFAKASLV